MRGPIPIRRFRSLPRPFLWLVAALALFQFGLGHLVHATAHEMAHQGANCPAESPDHECPFAVTAASVATVGPAQWLPAAPPLPLTPCEPLASQGARSLSGPAPSGRAPPLAA